MASDPARWHRLHRFCPGLCRIILDRPATTVRWAQPAGSDRRELLFLLLVVQMATGLVLAGTDLFWPPFGRLFADWIAAPGVDPGAIQPGASDLMDKAAYQSMRDFRGPFVEIHEIVFYVLAIAVVLHLMSVVVTELHEGGSITSAMFTGRKNFTESRRMLLEALKIDRHVEEPLTQYRRKKMDTMLEQLPLPRLNEPLRTSKLKRPMGCVSLQTIKESG